MLSLRILTPQWVMLLLLSTQSHSQIILHKMCLLHGYLHSLRLEDLDSIDMGIQALDEVLYQHSLVVHNSRVLFELVEPTLKLLY